VNNELKCWRKHW